LISEEAEGNPQGCNISQPCLTLDNSHAWT
jgi:hypothetical protein